MNLAVKAFSVLRDKLKRQYGWKVFRVLRDGELAGQYCGIKTSRPKGKWLKSRNFTPVSRNFDMPNAMNIYSYKPGWHVFRTRVGAQHWMGSGKIVKVLVRKIREKGCVGGASSRCFVADEIFIPK